MSILVNKVGYFTKDESSTDALSSFIRNNIFSEFPSMLVSSIMSKSLYCITRSPLNSDLTALSSASINSIVNKS